VRDQDPGEGTEALLGRLAVDRAAEFSARDHPVQADGAPAVQESEDWDLEIEIRLSNA
jgi:hypothetical protein